MNQTGISQFNQARIEWAIRLRYSPMPDLEMDRINSQMNAFRIGELRTVGKTWEFMMERDGELAINSDKRKSDSAGLDWQIVGDGSPDGDKHAAALHYFYNNLSATKALDQDSTGGVDELIYQTLSAVDYYYSAHEILLRVDNPAGKEITAEFRHTPVWFFEARRGYLGYLKHIFDLYGQPCIAGEWLTAVNLGWMRPLSLAFAAKWFSLTDWQLFARRYGSGFLEGITDAQRDSTEWNLASQALNQLSNDGTLLHNKDTEFKFLDQPAKNQLPFQPIVELVDRLYAKCYRGVDLATGSRGSGAASRAGAGQGTSANPVGASVQREESGIILVRDAKWVSGVFNDRIDRPILRYLFNEEPRAWFTLMPPLNDTTAEDLQALRTLVPMGMRVALKEVYQRFRWSAPSPGEPCLESPTSNGQSPKSGNDETNNQATSPSTAEPKPDETGQPLPAQTDDTTPIAAGADPARNPGLFSPTSDLRPPASGPSRQLPDTQVDSAAFWSRAALAPHGADGQVLPMPSLGYAIPNASTVERLNDLTNRGLGHTRAAQALQREIHRQQSLGNDGFDPDQLRDGDGRWTTEDSSSSSKTNTSPDPLRQLADTATSASGDDDDDLDNIPTTYGEAHEKLRRSQSEASSRLYDAGRAGLKGLATTGRAIAESNPIVGTADGAYEAATGKDAINSNKHLTTGQRWKSVASAAMSALPSVLKIIKEVKDVMKAEEVAQSVVKTEKAIVKTEQAVQKAKQIKDEAGAVAKDVEEHHLATEKNYKSVARGGPWSPQFEELFKKAGMTLQGGLNKILVAGHYGPHPEAYHRAVYDRLLAATKGLSGEDYTKAFKAALTKIGDEAKTPGTYLNNLLTK